MKCTIKTRSMGTVTFSVPGGSFVYWDKGIPSHFGTLGQQICHGGGVMGVTVEFIQGRNESDEKAQARFEKLCRSWWNTRLRALRG